MKKHRIIIPMLVICCVLLAIGGWRFRIFHNGVKLKPMSEYEVDEKIVQYKQNDAEWASDSIGESSYKMKTSGCLVSCIAAAVTMSGEQITPGRLNEKFSENAIYDSEGNIQWKEMKEIDGYHVEVYDEISNANIEKCLKDGNYPIVRVRMHGIGNFHYVLIVGTKDGEYVCMDPLQDELTYLSEYGEFVYAIRCVWFKMDDIGAVK